MKVLLVDDDNDVRGVVGEALTIQGFEVVVAVSVKDAIRQIVTQSFDVLVTDLHMPGAGDGFAVVTAMRHAQPDALTIILSGFPNVEEAMKAISLQADHVLAKPFGVRALAEVIRSRARDSKRAPTSAKESVASILERDVATTVERWLWRVEKSDELVAIPLCSSERTSYVPEIVRNIVTRLRKTRAIEAVALPSPAAVAHGELRHRQGYTAPLIVQESRILQVSIFETIQRNLSGVDFSLVLPDVMLIADEVDSQLSQSIDSFLRTDAQQS
jgi:ActR/RegA family two-component response regulator